MNRPCRSLISMPTSFQIFTITAPFSKDASSQRFTCST